MFIHLNLQSRQIKPLLKHAPLHPTVTSLLNYFLSPLSTSPQHQPLKFHIPTSPKSPWSLASRLDVTPHSQNPIVFHLTSLITIFVSCSSKLFPLRVCMLFIYVSHYLALLYILVLHNMWNTEYFLKRINTYEASSIDRELC